MVADFSVSCCEWECVCIHSAYHIWKVTCCQCGWEHLPPHYHHLTLQSHFVCLSWSPDSWMGPSLRDHSQRQTTSLWKAPITYVRIWCHWLSHASGKQSKYVWVWLSVSYCCHIRVHAHAQSTLKTSSCKASAKLWVLQHVMQLMHQSKFDQFNDSVVATSVTQCQLVAMGWWTEYRVV